MLSLQKEQKAFFLGFGALFLLLLNQKPKKTRKNPVADFYFCVRKQQSLRKEPLFNTRNKTLVRVLIHQHMPSNLSRSNGRLDEVQYPRGEQSTHSHARYGQR